jgi:phosphodiesterase/alkaline phosphatase D-like protein
LTIDQVLLTNLEPDTTYFYQVGDPNQAMSPLMRFKTLPSSDSVVDVIVYGDFGVINARSLPNLLAETSGNTDADMILHVGDWACKTY